mgnify:CR=1 FL=1|tara:strand:- start:227 stop:865 length:639 start_codon:yes stop_codon:yes gene_type:complete
MNTNKLNIKTLKTMKTNYLNFMKTTKLFIMVIFCLTLITSCNDDDDNPEPVNEVELITNVTLTFTNTANAGDVVIMSNVATDGQEGAFTNSVNGTFTAGQSYSLALEITNESDPADVDDVLNDDVIPEGDEHFFKYSNTLGIGMIRDASDLAGAGGSSLGVSTTWTSGAAGTGNLQIILVHQPETTDDSDQFGSTTGGEEDFRITFQGVVVQ